MISELRVFWTFFLLFSVLIVLGCDEIKDDTPNLTGVLNVPSNFATIQDAIDAAASEGAIVQIADGTYTGKGNVDLDTKGKRVRITGNLQNPELVVIDCKNAVRGLTFSGGENRNTILEGLTIANGNSKDNGGGLAIWGMPVISNCIIMNNVSLLAGGGVSCNPGSMPIFRNCLFYGNTSLGTSLFEGGGAIYCNQSEPQFVNCTISKNTSMLGGGIFSFYKSTPMLINSIVYGNAATNGGNEIFLYKGGTASGKMTLFNCDFENSPGNVDGTNIQTTNCINDAPGFIDSGNFNFKLSETSACVDAGDNFYLSPFNKLDLQGFPRIADKIVDIGAFEKRNFAFVADMNFEAIESEQSLEVQFTDTSLGSPTSWSWDFDSDGIEDSTEQNPVYTYTQTGLYTVSLTITKGTVRSTSAWKNRISFVKEGKITIPDDFENIQDALFAATDGDEITVRNKIYSGFWNRNIDFMGKMVSLISSDGAENTIIDCENLGRGFIFISQESPETILRGFTILNGSTEFDGSGLLIIDSNPTIAECVFKNCFAGGNGGGICVRQSSAIIDDCEISENRADCGAGIFVEASTISVLNCKINGNTAISWAGGVYIADLNMLLQNSVIEGNTAGNAAGIYIISASVNVNNCLIVENEAYFDGGGLYFEGKSCLPKMFSCTISRNRAKQGGGVFVTDLAAPSFKNSIIWSNLADDGMQFYASIASNGTGSIILTNCDYGATNDDVYDIKGKLSANKASLIIDPRFTTVADNDYFLASNSPCIDAGTGVIADYEFLAGRTNSETNLEDFKAIDLGFHYTIK